MINNPLLVSGSILSRSPDYGNNGSPRKKMETVNIHNEGYAVA